MSKHTREQWVSGNLPWRNGDGYSYGGESTVSIPGGPTLILGQGQDDTARLIAAAPKMLKALRDVESKIDDFVAGRINWRPDDFLMRVREAANEAEGRT